LTNSFRYGRKRALRHAKKRLEYQCELPLKTPLSQRLRMWRSGYRSTSRTLYDLNHRAADYLPDTARLETFFINGGFAHSVLGDKLLFTKLAGEVLDVPGIAALIERGEIFAEGSVTTLQELAAEHPSLVFKPSEGTRGQGVYRLEAGTLNGQSATPEALNNLARKLDNYLVTKTVAQAAYAETIFPASTNSVRVVTLIDPDTQEPFVARAVHRFGVADTVPTDNWSRGGLCADVDLETGTLSRGVKHPKRTAGRLEWQTHHPDTGAAIEGVVIPRWHEVCRGLTEAVQALPFLIYVGWDVVVTEDGFCVLEGNNNTDLDLLQVHGGLLKDRRVRRFYEHHGVI
jgi:hypothetical protein